MHEIQITRAGVNMSREKAAEFIANGYRVTVMAVSGANGIPSDIWAEIMAAGSTSGPSRARVKFAPLSPMDAEGASTLASVAVVASEVAMTADRLMAERDAANA